jgi:thiol-disulfide isomerase/thioredoxin
MHRKLLRIAVVGLLLGHVAAGSSAQPTRGITGRPAPSLGVERWLNLPPGKTRVDVGDYKGKVIYLYCFQSWCPGCHSHGFPTLRRLIDRYRDDEDVVFLAVQTAFEGFSSNSPEAAARTARRYELKIPVGHDGAHGQRSTLMRRYRTGGTPWTIIIDRAGTVRFDGFRIDAERAATLIERLKSTEGAAQPRPGRT